MSCDISRSTFNPWNDFNGVVMQQGRVQLDSDWNESLAELSRRIRAGTLDTMGRAVYPATTPNAFLITPAVDSHGNPTITIDVGRIYVDGLLAENHGLPGPSSGGWIPPSINGSTAQPVWDHALDELVGDEPLTYTQQPYFPNAVFPSSGGPYLIYLDVWQREVTFLEDPDLIEKAVGIDTTGRWQTVWQVKLLDVSKVESGVTCGTKDEVIGSEWTSKIQPSGGRLTTGVAQSSPSGPCSLAPNTGYTGMENQLYRVEIHHGGSPTSTPPATFKWSRDNASVATAITEINGNVLTVQSTGKDSVLRFSNKYWVEITDDWLELNGQHGELHQVALVDDPPNTITLSSAVTPDTFQPSDPSRHTRVVCWQDAGIPVPPAGTPVTLENGVTVSFDQDPHGGRFKVGDYWTFAARTADGTVEKLVEAPPSGIHHHYTRLAVLNLPNTVEDCRGQWPAVPAVTVEHDGNIVGSRNTLNFTGPGVSSVADNPLAQRIDIQISGAGSGESSPTRLLFPYCRVKLLAGGGNSLNPVVDTLIAISSTTATPFGPEEASGTVTLYCFGTVDGSPHSPVVLVASSSLAPGGQVAFMLSQELQPSVFTQPGDFQGYVIANCEFAGAYGLAQVTTVAGAILPPDFVLTGTYLPVVLSRDVLLSVSTLTCPTSVIVGGSVDFTVTLTDKVTVDTPVAISANPSGIATVPLSVTVPAGSASKTFTVATSGEGTLTLTATLQGGSAQASVSIEPLKVKEVNVPKFVFVGGDDGLGTVILNFPAPAGGATVFLSAGNAVKVPATFLIPPGSDGTGIQFNISPVSVGVAKITASHPQGVNPKQSNQIDVKPLPPPPPGPPGPKP